MRGKGKVIGLWLIVICSFCLTFISINSVHAENTEQAKYDSSTLKSSDLKKTDWEKQKENYQYVKEGEKKKKIEKEDTLEKKEKDFSKWNFDIDTNVARTILISLVIGVLILAIVLFLRKSNWIFNKKVNDKNLLIARLEENLPESDIDPHLSKAINEKDFRLAFRLYYLLLIQQLTLQKQVVWRKEKTNGEYLIECCTKNYYESFSKLTLAFDQVWYGEYTLNKISFDDYQNEFKKVLHQIKQPS